MIDDLEFLNRPAVSVTDAVQSRRSIRAFSSRPVDPALLRRLIELAARAPSGGNVQPWKVIILGGGERQALSDAVHQRIAENPAYDSPEYPIYPADLKEPHSSQRFKVGEAMYAQLDIPRADKAARWRQVRRNYDFFGAPVGLLCYVDRQMGSAQWSDLGMFLQTLMLLLREQGISSCAQESWSVYHQTVNAVIQPPPELMLFCGLAIGYADTEAPVNRLQSERLPVQEFADFRGI
ncbi:MAG: nitroreductase [Porticoccaceae bacterium]